VTFLKTLNHHKEGSMEQTPEQQLKQLNEFLEEQLWYIQSLAKERNLNLGVVRSLRETSEENLRNAFWMLQDVKAVLAGQL
jgi:hypothetical protein